MPGERLSEDWATAKAGRVVKVVRKERRTSALNGFSIIVPLECVLLLWDVRHRMKRAVM